MGTVKLLLKCKKNGNLKNISNTLGDFVRTNSEAIIGIKSTYNNNAGAIFSGLDLYICGVVGFIITGLLIWVTEYYTGTNYRPVKSVAKSSTTGHGTNVIQGLAVSMEATAIPALIIVAGILYTNITK